MYGKRHEKLFISTCSFLCACWVVKNLFKKTYGEKLIYWNDICCRYTLEFPYTGNSIVYLQHVLLKIMKKTIWKFTFPKYHVHCFTSFKHPKLPLSIWNSCHSIEIVYICMKVISLNLSSSTTSLLTWWLRGSKFNFFFFFVLCCRGRGHLELPPSCIYTSEPFAERRDTPSK